MLRNLDTYSHTLFLRDRLLTYLPENSFASQFKKAIPAEINLIFADVEPETVLGYDIRAHALFPVHLLFSWIVKHGGLTVENLKDATGQLFDDNGNLVPSTATCPISGAEQMAAFGLWFLDSELDAAGPSCDEDYDSNGLNPQGWYKYDVKGHQAECLLNASQALWYAERLTGEIELSADEEAGLEEFDFSALGKSGAVVRHGPMRALRAYAVSLYNPQEWKSANQAAHALSEKIMDYGRTRNAILQPANAQRTIAGWFRDKSV
jgi:hypothetical protein